MSLDCVAGVGGIMVIEVLAGTMRRGRLVRCGVMRGGEFAAECWDCQQMANMRGERNG